MYIRASACCVVAALIVLQASVAAAQASPTMPEDWERPTNADLAGPNLEFRKGKPGRYLVAEGDFDGDGVGDRAEILVNRISRTYAVYAFISKSLEPVELLDGRIKDVQGVGISTAKPGRTKTLCGKGYDAKDPDCRRGVPFVDIPLPSIEIFGFEASSSQFYWTGEKFERVWTSD